MLNAYEILLHYKMLQYNVLNEINSRVSALNKTNAKIY